MTAAERLAELKTALHSLLTGKRVVTVKYEDEILTFHEGSISALREEIAKAEAEVAEEAGTVARRPLRVVW